MFLHPFLLEAKCARDNPAPSHAGVVTYPSRSPLLGLLARLFRRQTNLSISACHSVILADIYPILTDTA
jgi:hypothetical protein